MIFSPYLTLSITYSLLLIEYVAATAVGHDVDNAILRKEKSGLPIPVSQSYPCRKVR